MKFKTKSCSKGMRRVFFAVILILLPSLFASCFNREAQGAEGAALADAEDAMLSYLGERIEELECDLAAVMGESYVRDAEYRARILALENKLSSLGYKETEAEGEDPFGSTEPPEQAEGSRVTLKYTVKDGEAVITGYEGEADTLVIPSSLGGYPVKEIADGAFSRTAFESIEVSYGVERIGWFAFSENGGLKSVILPSSIKTAGYGIFDGCAGGLTVFCDGDSYIGEYVKSYGIPVSAP